MTRLRLFALLALVGCSEIEVAKPDTGSSPTSETQPFARALGYSGLEPRRALVRAGNRVRAVDLLGKKPNLFVELPATSDGNVVVEDSRVGFRVGWQLSRSGARAPVRVVDDLALYAGVGPDLGDTLLVAHDGSVEDFVRVYRSETSELRYTVDVAQVAGLRLVGNVLELLDAEGVPRLRVARPYVVDAEGRVREAMLGVHGCQFDQSPRLPWHRPVTPPGNASCELSVRWDAAGLVLPLIVDPTWMLTDHMADRRVGHTLSVVKADADGNPEYVCVFGGKNANSPALNSTECFDQVTKKWSPRDGATFARHHHTASVLLDGTILVVAGIGHEAQAAEPDSPLSTSERFRPQTGKWEPGPELPQIRDHHSATVLEDGSVIVIGGGSKQAVKLARYHEDPAAKWLPIGPPMSQSRFGHAAVLVGSNIFVAGGAAYSDLTEPLDSAETLVIAGATANWIDSGHMNVARAAPTALLLPKRQSANGAQVEVVLVAGQNVVPEFFDPAALTDDMRWRDAPKDNLWRRTGQASVGLKGKNGDSFALLIGGENDGSNVYKHTEVFTRSSGDWSVAPQELNDAREEHAAAVLGDGHTVLVTGGQRLSTTHWTSEIVSLGGPGDTCADGNECLSGNCAMGVCCDTPCSGGCEACSEAKGAEENGTCKLLAAGTECGDTPQACEVASQCDGKSNVCQPLARAKDSSSCTTETGDGVCVDGACLATPAAGGAGSGGEAGENPAAAGASGEAGDTGMGGSGGTTMGERRPAIQCTQRTPRGSAAPSGILMLLGLGLLAARKRKAGVA